MRVAVALVALFVVVAWGVAVVAAAEQPERPATDLFEQTWRPFAERYCFDCHSGADAEGGIALDKYRSAQAVADDRAAWRKVLAMIRGRKMPPEESDLPPEKDRESVVAWLDAALAAADRAAPPDPGRVTIRRLNRAEYSNTIRDLLGVEFNATADFPADDVGYGFDNIGDVLTLSPMLMEKYVAAAEQIAAKAITADTAGRSGNQLPESHRRIITVLPSAELSREEAAAQILRRLAARAYRRPASDREVERLVRLAGQDWSAGGSFESGIRTALEAILVSPHFLFRVELDPPGGAAIRVLNEFELASRLSYFLWSSMPDDELFDLAGRGRLRAELDRQVRRMVRDAKARALVENFAGQWLQLRTLEAVRPDKQQFPQFDDDLRRAMRIEAEMFFEAIVRENRSVVELIDADYTFVNARLARFYGIEGVEGDHFRRVALQGAESVRARGGVLGLAAMLTVTSNPTRTSPVKRGKWVLENILGAPPPDPPPDVPMLDEGAQAVAAGTLRQRMEQHRSDPKCAVCHREMDALGFALENFDAVGAWRTKDGEFPIDAAAALPDGRAFDGPRGLKAVLRGNPNLFAHCFAEKLLTFALGRGVEYYDGPAVDRITAAAKASDYRFEAFVLGIVQSDPFQKRRGSAVKE